MTYTVKEIFKTIQGEGANTGRVAVFCRFAGCNLWSGREEDRATAVCRFCDTDFVGGMRYDTADQLADEIATEWGDSHHRMVVLTGGEPALQYDDSLRHALHARHFYIAVETNGTVSLKSEADWVCVSPKAGTTVVQTEADEVKVVFPQVTSPNNLAAPILTGRKLIQPMDGPDRENNIRAAIAFCLANPGWRLSLQTHKWTGVR